MDDVCLLCLELRHESVDCIYVISRQWEQEHIEQLIEQHFWPLESITSDSWICAPCWYVLNEFHKFYTRIEDAHEDLAITMNATMQQAPQHQSEDESSLEDFEEMIDKDLSKDIKCFNIVINLSDLNRALSMEQSVPNYFLETEPERSLDQLPIGALIENYIQKDQDHLQMIQFFEEGREEDDITGFLEDDMRHEQGIYSTQSNQFVADAAVQSYDEEVQLQLSRLLDDYVQQEQETSLDDLRTDQFAKEQRVNDSAEQDENTTEGEGPDDEDISKRRQIPKIPIEKDSTSSKLMEILEDEGPDDDGDIPKSRRIPKIPIEKDSTSSKLMEILEESYGDRSDEITLLYANEINDIAPKVPEEFHGEEPETGEACNEKADQTQSTENLIKRNNSEVAKFNDGDEETVADNMDIPDYQRGSLNKQSDNMAIETQNPCVEFMNNPDEVSGNNSEEIGEQCATAVRENICKNVSKEFNEENMPTESCNEKTNDETLSETHDEELINPEISTQLSIESRTDANSDDQSDNESPDAIDQGKTRLTCREYDDFLAKHFKIICDICTEKVQTFNELRKHFSIVHMKRVYVLCCNRKFKTRRNLVEHIRWHCDPDTYRCKYCGKVMSTKRCLDLHEKHVHEKVYVKHKCDICGKSFASANVLKNHKLIHLSDEEKQFQCNECDKKFGSSTLLSTHIRAVHMAMYIKICDICGKKLRCREDFQRHMLVHEGAPVPMSTCDICGIKMKKERDLRRHKIIKHPEGGKVEYKCPLCPRISDNLVAHRKHFNYQHEMEAKYKCSLCSKAFKKKSTLNEHMAYHNNNPLYTCPYCPKQFYSNANMHTHRKKDHPLEWLEARRKKYSGKLPPNHIPPSTLPLD